MRDLVGLLTMIVLVCFVVLIWVLITKYDDENVRKWRYALGYLWLFIGVAGAVLAGLRVAGLGDFR
jgi:hypothetical protein